MKMRSLLSLTIAGLLSSPSFATVISGKVTDVSGQPVEGAEVSIEGTRRVVTTDENGVYSFNDVKRQDYLSKSLFSENNALI